MNRKQGFLIVGLVLVLFYVLGFRLAHPQSGFSTAVGSASSSLVVVKKSDSYSVGQKVVAGSASEELSPVLGEITAVTDSVYSVSNGVFLESVEEKRISGRMIVVLPFLGHLFNVVGL